MFLADQTSPNEAEKTDAAFIQQVDWLESVGLLQRCNRMSISELLNPSEESTFSMWSDQEIFQSVKDTNPEEQDNYDSFPDESTPREKPTAKAVFSAIALINDYIESDTTNAADNLNKAMDTYSKQLLDHLIQNSSQTTITSFFQPTHRSD